MKRKVVGLLLAISMLVSVTAGCGKTEETSVKEESGVAEESEGVSQEEGEGNNILKDGVNNTITMVFPGTTSSPANLQEVEAAITEIVQKKIDCTVKLNILEWGIFPEQTNLMLSSGEDVDIVMMLGNVQESAQSGKIQDISGMVEAYAPETMDLMGRYINACYVGDALYGFPTYHEFASGAGLVCRTEVLDELGVDPASITTWDDVEGLLEQVKEAHPELDVLVPSVINSGILCDMNIGVFDVLQNNIAGVYADGSKGLEVQNIYKTEAFKEVAERAYEWNQKGYFIADSTTITDLRETFLKEKSTFGYIGTVHPGVATDTSIGTGLPITTISIVHPSSGTNNVANFQYSVPTGSDAPEKAVAVLNEIYSNPEVQNLIHYGIEGEDYEKREDGTIGYPEGVDNSNVGWRNETWLSGNASVGYAWETDSADIWEKYEEFNRGAYLSPAYGFTYNSENVKTEITAIENILDKYTPMIYSGLANPEESIAALNQELEAAGIDTIISDIQSQLDTWSQE